MPAPHRPRDPVNELYDSGCDLVEAAAGLRTAAVAPTSARATPAALGCFEASLGELAEACAALRRAADESVGRSACGADERLETARRRMNRGLVNLELALRDASALSAAARKLSARSLGRAGVTRDRASAR